MELPKIGQQVPMEEINKICSHFNLSELWEKIKADPPPKPFSSDGCSCWVDEWKGVSIYEPCFLHDLEYWAGYPDEEVERLCADARLMMRVAEKLEDSGMAQLMFAGVRPGGSPIFKRKFSWGFGRF